MYANTISVSCKRVAQQPKSRCQRLEVCQPSAATDGRRICGLKKARKWRYARSDNRPGGSMQFCRIYTGEDGKSHFEELEQNAGSRYFLASQPVKALVFKNDMNRDDLHGWHNAPRRQWCITLSGSVEIGIGDGTVRTFGPGDLFLAEDLTGQGHTALPKDCVRAFVHL
jgi:hypothetical protein